MRRKEIERYKLKISEGLYGDLISSLYFKEKKTVLQGRVADDFFKNLRESQDKISLMSKNILN